MYAKRLDADGTVMWAAKGVPVSTAHNCQHWLTLQPLRDNVLFCWEDGRPEFASPPDGITSAFLPPITW